MTAGYAAFPGGGKRVKPRFVDLVTADDGTVLLDERGALPDQQAISPQLAYLVVHLMKAVVERGTARDAQQLGRPAAGKTGTSTGFRDAWFIGTTADLITGVWIGRDDFTPIGDRMTGGVIALPIWLQFMRAAHPQTPARDFEPPDDVVFVRANEITGAPAAAGSPAAMWIPFMRGTVPAQFTSAVDAVHFRTGTGFLSGLRARYGERATATP
jgi:penicillin-binding protein 1A